MADEKGPLSEEDLRGLNEQLAKLDEAEKIVEQAIRGGIDMGEQKKQTAELRAQLRRIKQSFFPGR